MRPIRSNIVNGVYIRTLRQIVPVPCLGLAVISGYVNGVLTACPTCIASALPGWCGNFTSVSGPPTNRTYSFPFPNFTRSVSGKRLVQATIQGVGTGFQQMNIVCGTPGFCLIWRGNRTGIVGPPTGAGAVPAGVYTRTLGFSAGPSTFTVV